MHELDNDKVLVKKRSWALIEVELEGPVMRHHPCPRDNDGVRNWSYTQCIRRVKHPKCIRCDKVIPKWIVHLYTVANAEYINDPEYFEQEYNEDF